MPLDRGGESPDHGSKVTFHTKSLVVVGSLICGNVEHFPGLVSVCVCVCVCCVCCVCMKGLSLLPVLPGSLVSLGGEGDFRLLGTKRLPSHFLWWNASW